MGYHQAGITHITGVDIQPQPRYPFEFVQADALTYLAAHSHEFDIIHASPPCQRFSYQTKPAAKHQHPDLLTPTAHALRRSGRTYVIENVSGARHILTNPIMLCGTMFGLPIWRHRYFEINPPIAALLSPCNHSQPPVLITGVTTRKGVPRKEPTVAQRRQAIGIDWMTTAELDQAIPPPYTEWIATQLITALAHSPTRPFADSLTQQTQSPHRPGVHTVPASTPSRRLGREGKDGMR